MQVGLGDLDVIAEDGVEAYLEALDPGALLFGGFEIGEPGFVAAGERAHAVEFGVVAGADEIAFLQIGRKFVGQRAG